jgi:hypothetical protein
MTRRKLYKHIIESNFMGISDKIRKFVKPHKKTKTKGINK